MDAPYKIQKSIRDHTYKELVNLLSQNITPQQRKIILDRLQILNQKLLDNDITKPKERYFQQQQQQLNYQPPQLNFSYEQKMNMMQNLQRSLDETKTQYF